MFKSLSKVVGVKYWYGHHSQSLTYTMQGDTGNDESQREGYDSSNE